MNPPITPGKADLIALAERCEAATGPDMGLQRDIFLALGFGVRIPGSMSDGWHDPDNTLPKGMWGCTASIDAALTLVPDGHNFWFYSLLSNGEYLGRVFPVNHPIGTSGYPALFAKTAALAICAAALRARAAQ